MNEPWVRSRGYLVDVLTSHRLPLSDEKALQAAMAEAFSALKIDFRREVQLGPRDIVDFIVWNDVAIEVKIKGQRRAIFRQVERYCGYDAVGSLVLATNVPIGLPETINAKPISVAALGRGWL
ncbi:MAG: hypothetical protein PS018_17170 [bacterium]|nr:hypothetical protein [bacterium]